MSRPVYVSSGAFDLRDLEAVFDRAAAEGVKRIEMTSSTAPRADTEAVLTSRSADFDLLIHNYFPVPETPFVLNLASTDADIRQRSLAHCRRAMALSAKLGAQAYSVHAGFLTNPSAAQLGRAFDRDSWIPRARGMAVFEDSVAALLDAAETEGVDLLIENNVVAPFNRDAASGAHPLLLADAEEMTALCRRLDHPRLGLLIDFGHLKVSARTLDFDAAACLERTAPWIRALHLSDNDGTRDSNEPFGHDAWFLPWLGRLDHDYAVIEAYRLSDDQLRLCREAAESRG